MATDLIPFQSAEGGSPQISVIVPVFNGARWVQRAINSVLGQTVRDFELIVVDDGSTDESASTAESIPDPRIRVIRLHENRGGNAARNEGIRRAKGDVLVFLDTDDVFLPHKLETVSKVLNDRPHLGGMLDSFRKTYHDGASKLCQNPPLDEEEVLLEALFRRRLWKATSGISVRREAALIGGLFDERLRRRQDFDFLVRLIRSVPFATVSEVTWEKEDHPENISADLDSFLPAFLSFYEKYPEYYRDQRFRPGFAADLVRHFGKLRLARRYRQFGSELASVVKRFGLVATLRGAKLGIAERRQVKALRRLTGQHEGTVAGSRARDHNAD